MIYTVVAIMGAGGGVGALTDNLPVTQAEFQGHIAEYAVAAEELQGIQDTLDLLVLAQLRESLIQVYKDRCVAVDPQALQYINNDIIMLQRQHVGLTGSRFEPPPCGVNPA